MVQFPSPFLPAAIQHPSVCSGRAVDIPKQAVFRSPSEATQAFLQKGGVQISPVLLLMLTVRHSESRKDQKSRATPTVH